MAIFTGAGTIVSMSKTSTPPATEDATGYAALDWIELGCITEGFSFGATANQTEVTCLATGKLQRLPGAIDEGQMELTIAYDDTTESFPLLRAAVYNRLTYYFKVELPNKQNETGTNAIYYFGGKVTSNSVNVGSADDPVTTSTTITVNSTPVSVDSTAGTP